MKKDSIKIIIAAVILFAAILCANMWRQAKENFEDNASNEETEDEIAEDNSLNDGEAEGNLQKDSASSGDVTHIRDKKLIYDDDNSVVTMYLTVRKGNKSDGTNHTWEEVNTYSAYYYDERGIDRYKVEALLQVGDENGVKEGALGYGREAPNATVQIRGQTSSKNPQKNYKIELKKNQGSWNGQTTIALNKHMTDGLRFRNKLGFDLLEGIDQLMGLRTQFVHLYVNDLTDDEDLGFQDYGLYTQVEQLNKAALRTHGLDRTGHLYKINFFEFYRYEDVIKKADEPGYDKKAFEEYLEIKGNEDHTKLIEMLEDVNNMSVPIEDVIKEHFDMENLAYWMAFNILTGNYDTQSRNTYLYSPQNSDTWYLYCWDLDASFRLEENHMKGLTDGESWECGISNYWGNVLFQRCLKSKQFRDELNDAILELKDYMSKDRLKEMVEAYRKVVEPYVYKEPDLNYAPITKQQYEKVAADLPGLVDEYYKKYLDTLDRPMPFYIGVPVFENGKIKYNWEMSYDFNQEDVKYKMTVARDYEFKDVVESYEDYWPEYTGKALSPGQYFVKVQATNESGKTQDPFDYYEVDSGKIYGVLCFYINKDNSISVYTVVE
ncbi:CotH kinase family protein [Butyrivibrio sp. YAB3001]|uniref:CotH kinase family protein n=1 Tax=Butyrivibrio sp. YAB3001 TaxID=1520812 RepID=UPI0008F6536E|nr:CotH kinase family protein [Butyrivibrio sp. YAB3001]SFC09907.1 spore coat protein H [Butyrivibrio sp. YAB3001]